MNKCFLWVTRLTPMVNGFTMIDNNLFAAVSDEAQNVTRYRKPNVLMRGVGVLITIRMIITQRHMREFMM